MCDTISIMVHWICWISASFSSFHQFLNKYTSQDKVIQSWPLSIVIIIWTVKQIHHIFWEVIKKQKNLLICRLGAVLLINEVFSVTWYLPHSDCWYLPHSDLIFISRWLLIFTRVLDDFSFVFTYIHSHFMLNLSYICTCYILSF